MTVDHPRSFKPGRRPMLRGALGTGLAMLLGPMAAPATAAEKPGWSDPLIQLFRFVELDAVGGVREQLSAGKLDPNILNAQGQRPLHAALMQESGKVAEFLWRHPQIDLEAQNAAGERPLMLAALRGRLDWVKALVKAGAQVEPQRGTRAWTALHYACSGPDGGVLDWLLAHGAELNARSGNGTTPLMMAWGYGGPDLGRRVLAAGADATLRNDLGLSAWDFARRAGYGEAAERAGLRRAAERAAAGGG